MISDEIFFFRLLLLYSFQRTDFLMFWYQDGGDEENRTPDPLLARQVLSQLSYTPMVRLIVSQAWILRIFPVSDGLFPGFFPLSVRFLRV